MSTIRFSQSNSLPFRRLEDYELLQTDTTRLYYDLAYESITNTCYNIPIQQSKGVWFQYRTDYIRKTAYLVDSSGVQTDITSQIVSIKPLTFDRYQYECKLTLTGITGCYYILIEFDEDTDKPIANWKSEWFEVQTSFENSLLVEWSNAGSLATNDDGIIWGGATQKVCISSRLSDYQPGLDATVLVTSTGEQITTSATPFKKKIWQVHPLPSFMVELINIARGKHYFYINGEQYSGVSDLEVNRLGDISTYPLSMELRLIKDAQGNAYEDYTEDQELTGTLPDVPILAIYAADGKAIFGATGKAIGQY